MRRVRREIRGGMLSALALSGLAIAVLSPSASSGETVSRTFSSGNLNRGVAADSFAHERLYVPARGELKDVDLKLRMFGTDLSDLISVELGNPYTHGFARSFELVSGGGLTGKNMGQGPGKCGSQLTVIDDQAQTPLSAGTGPYAGSFYPDQTLRSSFRGYRMHGYWHLDIQNGHQAAYAALYCWKLRLTYQPAG